MNTSTSRLKNNESKALYEFKEAYVQEIQAIAETLVRITHLSEEAVKPYLDAMLEDLVKSKEKPLYETATPQELAQAFRDWAESHQHHPSVLSDYAVSRESIYEDEKI